MFSTCAARIALVVAVGAVALAVGAPGASAATTRYVAVGGSGTDCNSVDPCNLEDAVKASGAGDEVIARPGDYYLWSGLKPPAGTTIRGLAGQARPRLFVEAGNLWLTDMTLRNVAVIQQGDPTVSAISAEGSTLDQLVVQGPFAGDCALSIENGTVRNSVVTARSDGSAVCADAFQTSNSTIVRNVTAVSGKGPAIEAVAVDSTANVTVSVKNTIAKTGSTGVGFYVGGALGAHAKLTASHSYYANYVRSGDLGTVFVDAGGNTSIQPLFVNPADGDYRQKAGSVTIDAGESDPANGALDLDGDPRAIGAPDIGADEFVPAPTDSDTTPTLPPSGTSGSDTSASGGSTGSSSARAFAGVGLVSSRLTLKRGVIAVKLSCPAATAGRCTGTTKLSARRRGTRSRLAATVRLGRARFSIADGTRARVKVRVSRAGRRLVAHRRRLRGRAASAAHDAAGLSKTTIARVTIREGTR